MQCKDSDVFALEKYMDYVLDFEIWKDPYQIVQDFKTYETFAYSSLIGSKFTSHYDLESAFFETDYINHALQRLCFLFPMKYDFHKYMPNHDKLEDSNSILHNNSYMYKRKLGFR